MSNIFSSDVEEVGSWRCWLRTMQCIRDLIEYRGLLSVLASWDSSERSVCMPLQGAIRVSLEYYYCECFGGVGFVNEVGFPNGIVGVVRY